MKNKLKYLLINNISAVKFIKFYNINEKNTDALAAQLIRNIHSIEKGLSLKDVRLGFGKEKIFEMMNIIEKINKYNSKYYDEIISMAVSVMDFYIKFHEDKNYNVNFFEEIKIFLKKYNNIIKENFGGTLEINTENFNFNIEEIERFVNTRHSIRNFTSEPVKNEKIIKAIKLAQKAPSACNRQAVRVYVVDKEKAGCIVEQLSGIGGFEKNIDKFILVTGKLSSYKIDEINQFIVSASIFAGYLVLGLHLYGIGSCLIQRAVVWNKSWNKIKKHFNIPDDEQLVCMIAAGNVDKKITVPISHRIEIDEVAKFL